MPHAELCQAAHRLVRSQGRIEKRGRDPFGGEGVDLVLHQRDERRDDHRGARHQQCGELEAEALPRPRRHHDKRVSPLQHGTHDTFLAGAKGPEPEMAPQRLFKVNLHQGKGVA